MRRLPVNKSSHQSVPFMGKMSQQSKLQHFSLSASSSTASRAISSSDSDKDVPSEKKKKVELSAKNGLKTLLGYQRPLTHLGRPIKVKNNHPFLKCWFKKEGTTMHHEIIE